MATFLSTYVNKVDRKGRVSIPAQFRAALNGGANKSSADKEPVTIFVWPSLNHQALEGTDQEYLDLLSSSLESSDLGDAERDMIETFIFGKLVPLTSDAEGRIVLPRDLAEFAGITEECAFIGRRKTFQVWQPEALRTHEAELRARVVQQNISLSSVVAKASRSSTLKAGEGA